MTYPMSTADEVLSGRVPGGGAIGKGCTGTNGRTEDAAHPFWIGYAFAPLCSHILQDTVALCALCRALAHHHRVRHCQACEPCRHSTRFPWGPMRMPSTSALAQPASSTVAPHISQSTPGTPVTAGRALPAFGFSGSTSPHKAAASSRIPFRRNRPTGSMKEVSADKAYLSHTNQWC